MYAKEFCRLCMQLNVKKLLFNVLAQYFILDNANDISLLRLLLGLRCSTQISTAMEVFVLIFLKNSGVLHLQSLRFSFAPIIIF